MWSRNLFFQDGKDLNIFKCQREGMRWQCEDVSKYSLTYSIIIDYLLHFKPHSRHLGCISKQNKHFCHHEAYNPGGEKAVKWIITNDMVMEHGILRGKIVRQPTEMLFHTCHQIKVRMEETEGSHLPKKTWSVAHFMNLSQCGNFSLKKWFCPKRNDFAKSKYIL